MQKVTKKPEVNAKALRALDEMLPLELMKQFDLTPVQCRVALHIATPRGVRISDKELCAELGMSHASYYRIRVEKGVQDMAMVLMRRTFFTELADVIDAMRKKAVNGSIGAAALYIQFCEQLQQLGGGITINLTNNHFYSKEELDERIKQLRENTEPAIVDAEICKPETTQNASAGTSSEEEMNSVESAGPTSTPSSSESPKTDALADDGSQQIRTPAMSAITEEDAKEREPA